MDRWLGVWKDVSFGWTYDFGVDCGDGLGVWSRDNTLPIELLSRDIGEDYTFKYIHFFVSLSKSICRNKSNLSSCFHSVSLSLL